MLETNLHREHDAWCTALDMCPLKADHCGGIRIKNHLLCRSAPYRSHSGCMSVTHFRAGLGHTMQKVKPGLWVEQCYSRLAALKVSYHSHGGGRSDRPRQHDLEEGSSSLGLYCTTLFDLLGYKGVPHPGCGLPNVCVSYSPQPSSIFYLS